MMKAPSIDPKELPYYEKLADQWWDKEGKFWPLHRLNVLRIAYLTEKICQHFDRDSNRQKPLSGLEAIDIGCGGGLLSESIARLGANVHGIDVVEKNILVATQHNRLQKLPVRYEYVSVEEVAEREQAYDIVLNMEVVEHVANLPDFLASCTRLVTADGISFIATINRNWLSWLTAIVGAEYILHWLPKGTHQWRKFVKPEELKALLQNHGLEIESGVGISVSPISKKFKLTKSLMVNYMISACRSKPHTEAS